MLARYEDDLTMMLSIQTRTSRMNEDNKKDHSCDMDELSTNQSDPEEKQEGERGAP